MNQQKQPVVSFPLESPEKWAKIRAAAEKGDAKKLREAVEEMELSVKLAQVFITAVNEEAEIAGIVAAGKGMAESPVVPSTGRPPWGDGHVEEKRANRRTAGQPHGPGGRGRASGRAQPSEPAPASAGYIASFRNCSARNFRRTAVISVAHAAAKTSDALRAVGVSDFYGSIGAWRQVGQVDQTLAERRRRTYTQFQSDSFQEVKYVSFRAEFPANQGGPDFGNSRPRSRRRCCPQGQPGRGTVSHDAGANGGRGLPLGQRRREHDGAECGYPPAFKLSGGILAGSVR